MAEQAGYDILRSLQRQWRWQGLCYCLLIAMACSLLLTALLWWFLSLSPLYGALIFLPFLSLSLYTIPYWRLSVADTARFLDQRIPELEDSCGLLLIQPEQLGPLQQLQADRVAGRLGLLQQLQSVKSGGIMEPVLRPRPLQKKLITAFITFAAAVVVTALIAMNPPEHDTSLAQTAISKVAAPVEKQAPQVAAVSVHVVPPAYTGRVVRQQPVFGLRIEEGAQVSWQINTSQPADSLCFIFNDTIRVALKADDKEGRSWRLSLGMLQSGFYQVKVNDQSSDLYKLEVVKDEPPHITIRHPKPYTIVDFGESRKIAMAAQLHDDYGISDASIIATVASGSGEAVKFKEQTLRFDRGFNGTQSSYDLDKMIDLDALGLHPGDELYFFCQARDNHGQTTRSDMYIISLPDTAQLMSLEGLTSGLDIKPELFRSERQIIIETEQLLKAKDTIAQQAFNNKSNDLGIDQKLLRLRYGKFLGEEAEEGGTNEGFDAVPKDAKDFGNVDKVRDAFTDKHDNAEDATYFEPAIKEQLKATLTEMWNAELRLRTNKPQEALPFEYKALRLLKDLQQKSRAFVAKTGVKTTPLDRNKRLTGKLEEIGSPQQHQSDNTTLTPSMYLRITLSLLDQYPAIDQDNGPSQVVLQQALHQLAALATSRPGQYLQGYQAMRRLLSATGSPGSVSAGSGRATGSAASTGLAGSTSSGGSTGSTGVTGSAGSTTAANDIMSAQQAIRQALPAIEPSPDAGQLASDAGLSRMYFINLQSVSRKP